MVSLLLPRPRTTLRDCLGPGVPPPDEISRAADRRSLPVAPTRRDIPRPWRSATRASARWSSWNLRTTASSRSARCARSAGRQPLRDVVEQPVEQRPHPPGDLVLAGTERPDLVEGERDEVIPGGRRVDETGRAPVVADTPVREVLGRGVAQEVLDAVDALHRCRRIVHGR